VSSASDSWRVRVVRLDEYEYFDFEWHENILDSKPQSTPVEIAVRWRVDIISLADGKVRRSFAGSESRDDSVAAADRIVQDLQSLTAAEFSDHYMVIP